MKIISVFSLLLLSVSNGNGLRFDDPEVTDFFFDPSEKFLSDYMNCIVKLNDENIYVPIMSDIDCLGKSDACLEDMENQLEKQDILCTTCLSKCIQHQKDENSYTNLDSEIYCFSDMCKLDCTEEIFGGIEMM